MEVLRKESFNDWQDKCYSDSSQWHITTVMKPSTRLSCVLRYAKILQLWGLLKTDKLKGGLKILEPGCGIGSLSAVLSIFGETFSFDYSKEAIKVAISLFGYNKAITFFEGDGTNPKNIPELARRNFDFILIREFYPLTRNIVDNPRPIEIVKEYYNMLNNGGVIIIEHAFNVDTWRKKDEILQTSKIIKDFDAFIVNTLCLDLMLNFPLLFKYKKLKNLLARLLNPIAVILCLLTKIRLTKTIIIKK